MVSHVSRGGLRGPRANTLAALANAGVMPHVLESTTSTPSDVEVKRMAYLALLHAGNSPDGLLFVEDDLMVDEVGLRWAMQLPLPHADYDLVTFCLLRESLLDDGEAGAGYHVRPLRMRAFHADKGFHGTMAVWLRQDLVQRGIDARLEFMQLDGSVLREPVTNAEVLRGKPCGFDFWLKDRATAAAALVPNVVQPDWTVPSTIRPQAGRRS